MRTSNALREQFLDFFEKKGHTRVPSSSLVPADDPTLLFTNAGMVQFKGVFLGQDERPYQRATSSQRCVRAGGKHNDLDQVGYTARHHTFFEMLGNFSFGDYFKTEAIQYAWTFLTEVLAIDPSRLWVTVYEDDDEAAQIWQEKIGLAAERIIRCGEKSNFWSMGDTGPCGPCTEIFYDHGAEVAGGLPGTPEEDGDRYIEIWNLVFMQFNRSADGALTPLPKPAVDTGMGLERLTAVMQGVHNNYETDVFTALLEKIGQLAGRTDVHHTSMRVIADHIRSCAFLIVDGVLPSNMGRGYVLRRIIRRAIRHGHRLGINECFFYRLVPTLIATMGEAYPELSTAQARIEGILKQEEKQFLKTLDQGLRLLSEDIRHLTHARADKGFSIPIIIPGAVIFKLYDTYGFPPDLTNDIAREQGLSLDMAGFEAEMAKQRALSQQGSRFISPHTSLLSVDQQTTFTGYEALAQETLITALVDETGRVDVLTSEQQSTVILEHSPFYAESGGQIGDKGFLITDTGRFEVQDTQKNKQAILHHGHLIEGYFEINQTVQAVVDKSARQATALNHSATHLLHAALKTVLGASVQQKGSLVTPEKLRFDFAYSSPLTVSEKETVEDLVNQAIRANYLIKTDLMSQKEALACGAEALFGEKYGEEVRVLTMGEVSRELCGGTHAERTGDIGLFLIIGETGIAAGIRRIEALTGSEALRYVSVQRQRVQAAAELFKTNESQLVDRLKEWQGQVKDLQKQKETLSDRLAEHESKALMDSVISCGSTTVLIAVVTVPDMQRLRILMDKVKSRLSDSPILLAAIIENKVQLLATVPKALTAHLPASAWVNQAAEKIGGKGGGRPDQAQAGGSELQHIDQAMAAATAWILSRLNEQ